MVNNSKVSNLASVCTQPQSLLYSASPSSRAYSVLFPVLRLSRAAVCAATELSVRCCQDLSDLRTASVLRPDQQGELVITRIHTGHVLCECGLRENYISKPTLPQTALDSTGKFSQSPSSRNKVPNCQNLDSLSQHCDRLSQSVPKASTMTDCPRHTEYKRLALASLSLVPLPLALAQLAPVQYQHHQHHQHHHVVPLALVLLGLSLALISLSLAPLTLTSLTLAFDYIYHIFSNQTLLYLDYITTSIYDLISVMNLVSICDVFNHQHNLPFVL